eukprot:scaffold217886_cov30-Tisochrysis_lutea.AAC.7
MAAAGGVHGRPYSAWQRNVLEVWNISEASISSHILETMYAAVSVMKYETSLAERRIARRTSRIIGALSSLHRRKSAVSRAELQHQSVSAIGVPCGATSPAGSSLSSSCKRPSPACGVRGASGGGDWPTAET